MFEIFLKVLPIFLLIFTGYLVRRLRMVDDAFNRQLSLLLINLFYPALILSAMLRNYTLESLAANWTLPAGTAIIMCAGWMLGRLAQPWLQPYPETLRRTFHFQCTMNNYSFLPIMLAAGLLGERAVAQVVFASLGAELAVWTLGIQTLTGHALSRNTIRNLYSMPMGAITLAIGLLTGRFLLAHFGVQSVPPITTPHLLGAMLLTTCQMIGQATIPVSAVICGSRMATLQVDHLFANPMLGMLNLRLLAIPALAIGFLSLLPLTHPVKQVLMIIAVQPCSLASVTLSEIYRSDSRFAAASILITHVACLISIPIWLHFLL